MEVTLLCPLGFALVGCGDVSEKHVQAIKEVPGCELVAACDRNEEALKQFANKNPVEGYSDYSQLLSNPKVDVVDICTPSSMHCSQVVTAALAHKHILVEKPAALSLREMDLAIEAVNSSGVTFGVVHQNRFNKPVRELYRAVNNGLFGRITHAGVSIRRNRNRDYYNRRPWRKSRRTGGGVLVNQAIHSIDLLQWIMGPVKEVFAYTGTYCNDIEGEEIGTVVLRFTGGAQGLIEAASTIYPGNLGDTLNVFGEKGTVIIGGQNTDEATFWKIEGHKGINSTSVRGSGNHVDVIEDLVEAITTGRKPYVDGNEARKSLQLLLAIYKSADTGMPVRVNQL